MAPSSVTCDAAALDVEAGVSVWVPGLALVADLHGGAAVLPVGCVAHVLDPPVRQRHLVLAHDVAVLVPGPADQSEVTIY